MKKRLYQALLGLVLSASVAAGGFFAAVPQTAYAQNVATDSESGYHLANYAQTECQFRYCGTAIPFLTVRSTAR